jgi:glycosidase
MLILLISVKSAFSLSVIKVEPPNWWAAMETDTLDILLYGDDFTSYYAESTGKYAKILSQSVYQNPSYCKLTLVIQGAGTEEITFRSPKKRKQKAVFEFPVYNRREKRPAIIDGSDVIYLLMPDRFADGDTDRNYIEGHKDPVRPDHKWGRRGGDLQGVLNHLDYLEELGISVLWMTPVFENNYINCYHGYTPTDLYAVDPHLGDTAIYKTLVRACQNRGIKVIKDHILNHISPTHPLAVNPPSPEWINYTVDDFEKCNYRISDITDFWGYDSLKQTVQSGWFAGYLADMNLRHPDVVNYWITHTIWWVEMFGLDGIRQDTWPYSDSEGAAAWIRGIRKEYPEIFIVGETMVFEKTGMSYFFSSNPSLNNGLSSVTDFAFASLIYQLILKDLPVSEFHRDIGFDYILKDPLMLTVFMDNHDMGRFFTDTKENISLYLNAFTFIYGLRGIPQLFYGDEIGMTGGHDPENRNEFPGGFSYTPRSAFLEATRTDRENLLFNQFKSWNKIRKDLPGLFTAPMKHLIIENKIYAATRQNQNTILLVLYNSTPDKQQIPVEPIIKNTMQSVRLIAPLPTPDKAVITDYTADLEGKTAGMWLITVE